MDVLPVKNPKVLPKNGVAGQIDRILDEWKEAHEAFHAGNVTHADEEVMDVVVACSTYFDLRGMNKTMIDNVYKRVETKNRMRGYYDVKD